MNEQPELVTVFRSLDVSAADEADRIRILLSEAGLAPLVLDDSAPGVVEGTWEVRVPATEAARAEQLIAQESAPEGGVTPVDPSAELDLEPIFHAEGGSATAELEATEVTAVLTAAGIDAVMVGNSTLPNLPFEVRVPKSQADQARSVIAEAQAAGPEAAEQGAAESTEIEPQA